MQLGELYLNRLLYRDNSQSLDTKDSTFVSADSSEQEPVPIPSGGAAQDINTGNVTIDGDTITPGSIPATTLDVSNWGWGQTCAFVSATLNTVTWGAGTFTSANGVAYAIGLGTTGVMSAKTYIYLDLNVSEVAYQVTTTSSTAVGVGKVLIAVAENAADDATYMMSEATQLVSDNIIANTIDASKLSVGQLSAIAADIGSITAGSLDAVSITGATITGTVLQTGTSGFNINITAAELQIRDGSTVLGTLKQDDQAGTTAQLTVQVVETGLTATNTISVNSDSNISILDDIRPSTDGGSDLGTSSYGWGRLYLRYSSTSPSTDGEIRNYSSGGTEQFRGIPGNSAFLGSFDLTAA
ncbi:MAG: hypothetical protein KAS32_24705 [Candidatus Peribacteraceae bacterium]|nr:hypothetical protein [Candidatus Peribacteraceae bacterium]